MWVAAESLASIGRTMSAMIALTLLIGFGTGMSLLVVIGAQNAFVLRQGLRGEHVAWVVVLCSLSDAVLISIGTAGLGGLSRVGPWVVPTLTYVGVAFLVVYGALTLRHAFRAGALEAAPDHGRATLVRTVATCLALTWLNPHVYLDTVLLLGSIATSHQPDQWWFAVGAAAASCVWFAGIGFGARWLRPLFASPKAWRVLDIGVALVMWAVAASLVWGSR